MATSKRTYPNNYFAWYNDDERLAIVNLITSTDNNTGVTAGEYDTYSNSDVASGIRITYHGKYPEVEGYDDDLFKDIGLDSGLHSSVVCYVKYRIFEDLGDMQKALYFRKMFTDMFNKYPLRKSGVRRISVSRM
tara:strand:+ start:738 stop:1139 length:402 start_codon:yes stop_codon:yes gene_type:complete